MTSDKTTPHSRTGGGRHRRPDEAENEQSRPAEVARRAAGRAEDAAETAQAGRHQHAPFPAVPRPDAVGVGDETRPIAAVEAERAPADAATERIQPLAPALVDEPRRSRAGRNLPAAIGVGAGIGALVVASLLIYRPSFVVILTVAVLYGIWEISAAVGAVAARPPLVPMLVGTVAMEVAAWFRGPNGLVVALLVTACGVAIWRLADGPANYQRDVSAAILVLLYLPLLAGFAVLLTHPHDGAARMLLFLGTVVCSDTGGYATGVLLGKHPLAPTVSKGKTWEGLVGSVIACCLCGALVLRLTFHHAWWEGIVFGLAIAVTATLGDLGESMIKRDLGLKDMGRLLPGHGGLMDRLDSLLPCAVVAYLLLSVFLDH